jgi:HK97 family phage prohead protease
MSRLEYKTIGLRELKAGADGAEFEGLASAFYLIDDSWCNDIIAPGAFVQDLPEFLERGFVGGVGHDWAEPIGRPLHAEETGTGLFVRASVSDTAHGRDVRTLLKDGVIRFLSIGFQTKAREWLDTFDDVMSWWTSAGYTPTAEDLAKAQFGARLLTRIKLFEFSPVSVPANRGAAITAVKAADARGPMPLTEHSEAVLATLDEWTGRLEAVQRKRAEEGRELSPEHRAGLRRVRARIDGFLGEAERSTGAGTRREREARALYERYALSELRLRSGRLVS